MNADIGEHDGDGYAADLAILSVVSSASIACGAHAGSVDVMRKTIAAAAERGVSIGAHPGYPDREGFGRRATNLEIHQILDSFEEQVALMIECCASEAQRLRYVKPHGALYNRAARDTDLADGLCRSLSRIDSSLVLLGLAGSEMISAATSRGIRAAQEAFIDRGYMADGSLVPRDRSGALISDTRIAGERAIDIARNHSVTGIDGTRITVSADSLCTHGDGSHALEMVSAARRALEQAGFTIAPFAP